MTDLKYIILDFETFSEVDLKEAGAHEYAMHSSTEVLCCAWATGRKDASTINYPDFTKVICSSHKGIIQDILRKALDENFIFVAHNAGFERVIAKYVLEIDVPIHKWLCTASMAASLALPRKLEEVCQAMSLKHQKDMEGHRLMLKLSQPRRPTKHNPSLRHTDEASLKRLMEYCAKDVQAEVELFLKLRLLDPSVLGFAERTVWMLNEKINERGFVVDREFVHTALDLIKEEIEKLNEETYNLTSGRVSSTTQRDKTLHYLNMIGTCIDNLQAKTISDFLKGPVQADGRRILEIRQEVSRTSTAKYQAFEVRSNASGTCRDNLLYHGASTGRFSGQGVQVQNFPRGKIKNTAKAVQIIKSTKNLELIRLLYGSPMEVFSSCLRGVIVPREGKEFFCADYAAIEARVLFWVAKHEAGLKAFREDRDLYKEMASSIFRKPVDKISKDERFLGKTAVLGCGYGVGKKKFKMTCEASGVEISEDLAELAVLTYRTTHWPIPSLWKKLEMAVFAAVDRPGTKYTMNYTKWWVKNDFLWCELPSGRKLAYHKPEIQYDETPWGEKRPKFYCMAINSTTRKWERQGLWAGVFTENVVQAISRDLLTTAMIRMEDAGYEVTLSVHDEILAEKKWNSGSLSEFEKLMSAPPEWGQGIPIKVDAWVGERYHK